MQSAARCCTCPAVPTLCGRGGRERWGGGGLHDTAVRPIPRNPPTSLYLAPRLFPPPPPSSPPLSLSLGRHPSAREVSNSPSTPATHLHASAQLPPFQPISRPLTPQGRWPWQACPKLWQPKTTQSSSQLPPIGFIVGQQSFPQRLGQA